MKRDNNTVEEELIINDTLNDKGPLSILLPTEEDLRTKLDHNNSEKFITFFKNFNNSNFNVNFIDEEGTTALHAAAHLGLNDLVELLIKNNANGTVAR